VPELLAEIVRSVFDERPEAREVAAIHLRQLITWTRYDISRESVILKYVAPIDFDRVATDAFDTDLPSILFRTQIARAYAEWFKDRATAMRVLEAVEKQLSSSLDDLKRDDEYAALGIGYVDVGCLEPRDKTGVGLMGEVGSR
jgi:hypothetical protein